MIEYLYAFCLRLLSKKRKLFYRIRIAFQVFIVTKCIGSYRGLEMLELKIYKKINENVTGIIFVFLL